MDFVHTYGARTKSVAQRKQLSDELEDALWSEAARDLWEHCPQIRRDFVKKCSNGSDNRRRLRRRYGWTKLVARRKQLSDELEDALWSAAARDLGERCPRIS